MFSRVLHAILIGIAALALLVPALVVRYGPRVVAPRGSMEVRPHRVVPATELPAVEPVALAALTPDEARAYNSDVPFSDEPNPPARAFRDSADADDLARARDCLAAAVYYEAGDDAAGERAVAQVVLNRVRHPVYPKTVCGVVFQGAERRTGCQFTFTCDGSIAHYQPTEASWAAARAIAAAALAGAVYPSVGWATHYHTDYVVPYWQASLDKLVAVHTQLFYRWSGWWGTPPAFDRRAEPSEPVIAALAELSEVHRASADPSTQPLAEADLLAAVAPEGWAPKPVAGDANSFLVTLPPDTDADLYPALAAKACGDRATCKFDGWMEAKRTPARLPIDAGDLAAMSFGYLRDRATGVERTLWNCAQARRVDPKQCLKVQVFQPVTPTPAHPTNTDTQAGAPDLAGIRRKSAQPVATPLPSASLALRDLGKRRIEPPAPMPPGTSQPVAP